MTETGTDMHGPADEAVDPVVLGEGIGDQVRTLMSTLSPIFNALPTQTGGMIDAMTGVMTDATIGVTIDAIMVGTETTIVVKGIVKDETVTATVVTIDTTVIVEMPKNTPNVIETARQAVPDEET